jgi:hypothetical protein
MGPGNAQLARPFPQFSNVTLINPPVGNSSYEGGFIKLERRFSRGFALLAHYTFSKFLDDAASATEFGDPGSYMDAYNRRLDKGRSGSDVPHRAVITLLYAAPAFHKALANAVLGGWQIGALSVLQSGQTFTVYDWRSCRRGANPKPLVQHGGFPDSVRLQLRQFAVVGAARARVEERGPDSIEELQNQRALEHGATRRVFQRDQSRQLRYPWAHAGQCGLRRNHGGRAGAHGAGRAAPRVLRVHVQLAKD